MRDECGDCWVDQGRRGLWPWRMTSIGCGSLMEIHDIRGGGDQSSPVQRRHSGKIKTNDGNGGDYNLNRYYPCHIR